MSGDYEVGYGRPPKDKQFKPGKSGNPKGRLKGSRSRATITREVLDQKVTLTQNGRQVKKTLQEVIIQNFAHQAAKGSIKHIEKLEQWAPEVKEDKKRGPVVIKLRMCDDDPPHDEYP